MKNIQKFGILLFVAWLSSGALGIFIGVDAKKFAIQEMRAPATIKEVKAYTTIHSFFDDFEAFVVDRIVYREQYIALYQILDLETIASQFINGASLKGKELWLFLGNSYGGVLDYTKNNDIPSEDEIAQKIKQLQTLQEIATSNKIPYAMLVPPNKHTIYSEFLPSWVQPKSDERFADILQARAQENNLYFIFPKKELLLEKENADKLGKRLYWKDDTHWNAYGALVSFKVLWKVLKEQNDFSDIENNISLNEIQKEHNGDLISIGKYSEKYRDVVSYSYDFKSLENQKLQKKKHLLVLGDSFTGALMPLYEACFEKVTRIHWGKVNIAKYKELIHQIQPDAVICQIVERNFRKNGISQ